MEISQIAADTCIWPLYEVEQGEWNLTYRPREKRPVEDYLETQGRFRHLFKDDKGEQIRQEIQRYTDYKWQQLLERCGEEE
jgi:pyruvate ferredoxin oxidoreductase beta subunit